MKKTDPARSSILIIDDVEQIRLLLAELLCMHDCVLAASAEEALALIETRVFAVVISDINMPGISGLELVPGILQHSPDTVVVMVSGEQTIEAAIESMRAGAFDYITKPLDLRHVRAAVARALRQHDLLVKKRHYEDHLAELVRERTAEVEHLAFYDRLTDLPNRTLFADRCTQALANAQRNNEKVAVLFLALDRFKKIVETLGHEAGDVVVAEAGTRLRQCLNDGDTLARTDGDEFAILLSGIKDTAEVADLALRVSDAFKTPFQLSSHDVYVSTSIGISDNGDDAGTILRNAGAALYRAKQIGGNSYQFYAAEMNARAVKRLALETSIRRAIDHNEFVTYYQPIVSLSSNELIGAEALVRWRHPEDGVLSPAKFIALAEDTGLILDISQQVMREACTQARLWQNAGRGRLRMAVNISARCLQQPDFLEQVVEILSETMLDPSCIELELTETIIMENTAVVAPVLARARKLGMKVAIDDFGTGYSSLSYLKQLPIDTVKLDQSFVKGATSDPADAALVLAIVTLAHNLKLKVIAEGIETPEQLAFLRLLRCDEGQGYLFGKPMSPENFQSCVTNDPKRKNCVRSEVKKHDEVMRAASY